MEGEGEGLSDKDFFFLRVTVGGGILGGGGAGWQQAARAKLFFHMYLP